MMVTVLCLYGNHSHMKNTKLVAGVDSSVDVDMLDGWAYLSCPMSWKSSLKCLKQMWNNTDGVNTVYSAKTKLETYENRRKSSENGG